MLQLTAHFRPNIGGVETHLDDLCKALVKRGFKILVLTYRPLHTKTVWKILERDKNIEILRIPWIPNLFYKFIKIPILEFLYLLPGLFFVMPIILIFRKIDVIHAHGLVAGFVGVFWGRLFGKKVIISSHSIYHFPKTGLYRNFTSWIFKNADWCLGLSQQAVNEIKSLGVSTKKISKFTYWIDLQRFSRVPNARQKLGWQGKFVVLFVGRLVEEKGLTALLESTRSWNKEIILVIAGHGPLEAKVKDATTNSQNIKFIGSVNQDQLPVYYSASNILIVPSTSDEGFGRVILESLACGTPVVGAKRGAIPEAVDDTVGKLIEITSGNIKNTVEYFRGHIDKLASLANNSRKFAERRFAEKNVETIIKVYTN